MAPTILSVSSSSGSDSDSSSNNSREGSEAPSDQMEVDAGAATGAPAAGGMSRAPSGQEKGLGERFPALSDDARAEKPEYYCAGRWLVNRATVVRMAAGEAKDAAEALDKAAQSEVNRLRRVAERLAERREEEAREEAKRSAAKVAEEAKASFLKTLATLRVGGPEVVEAFCRSSGRDEAGNLVAAPKTSTKAKVQARPAARPATGKMITLPGSSIPGLEVAGSSSETLKGESGRVTRGGRSGTVTGKTITLEVESDEGSKRAKRSSGKEVYVDVPPLPKRVREPVVEPPAKRARAPGAAASGGGRAKEEATGRRDGSGGGGLGVREGRAAPQGSEPPPPRVRVAGVRAVHRAWGDVHEAPAGAPVPGVPGIAPPVRYLGVGRDLPGAAGGPRSPPAAGGDGVDVGGRECGWGGGGKGPG
ncbi:hypothetical protein ACEPAF_7850 [Sanghuangporus sanghuang]